VGDAQIDAAAAEALRPFGVGSAPEEERAQEPETAENPYTVHQDLQRSMNELVGIIRREEEMSEALERLAELRERARRAKVEGHRQFNPGWHLALDLRNMLLVSECVARAALNRTESRGGHTRDDHPEMDREWRRANLVCTLAATAPEPAGAEAGAEPAAEAGAGRAGRIALRRREMPPIRKDLLELFEKEELIKYLTDEELTSE
ncbi:succinate dehydrogenase, partial [Streptomyces nanshensis]